MMSFNGLLSRDCGAKNSLKTSLTQLNKITQSNESSGIDRKTKSKNQFQFQLQETLIDLIKNSVKFQFSPDDQIRKKDPKRQAHNTRKK